MDIHQLVQLARQEKNQAAMEEICRRFAPLIKKYSRQYHVRTFAEDVEGEAWLALVEAISTYDRERGVFFPAYAASKVKFAVWNLYKKNARCWEQEEFQGTARDGEEGESREFPDSQCVEEEVILAEEIGALRLYMQTLSPLQQYAIRETMMKGRILADIGEELGVTLQAVYRQRQRGIRKMRKLMDKFQTGENS